jgi:hypothetical protein
VVPRIKEEPKYFIYYNNWTGEILSVRLSEDLFSQVPFIVTQDDAARKIIQNQAGEHDYLVGDIEGQDVLLHKSEFLNLRKKENALFILPNIIKKKWDIRARLYTTNMKLVIELNRDTLSRLTAQEKRRTHRVKGNHQFEFYIIKRNAPDFLFSSVAFDVNELIENRLVILDLTDIKKRIDTNNISVMTKRLFENYYFEIIDDKYVSVGFSKVSNSPFKIQALDDTDDGHICITQEADIITIKPLISAYQFDGLNIRASEITCYVVDDTPDALKGEFKLDIAKLRVGKSQSFKVNFDIKDVNILYRQPLLKLKREIEN